MTTDSTNSALLHQSENVQVAEEGQCDCACQPDSQMLSVWMHITDACNLDCSYCYLPHKTKHMSLSIGQSIIDSAIRSARAHFYRSIKIKYAGGEPLLRLPTVFKLHSYALRQTESNHLHLQGVILTNGTLLHTENAAQILTAGLRLMISLDGMSASHNRQRHYRDGSGSFEQVKRGIETARAVGLIPELSITVSNQSVKGLPELMEWVLDSDLPFSINFYRKSERSAKHSNLDIEEQAIIDGLLAAFQVIEKRIPRRSLLTALVDRSNLAVAHSYPCAAGRDYLVFDPDGQIAMCQMQLEKPITTFESPDPLYEIHKSEGGFRNPAVDTKSDCQMCQWKYYCAGGCPLQAFQSSGNYQAKSPNCNIYQALFPEVLRLETMRLEKLNATSTSLKQQLGASITI